EPEEVLGKGDLTHAGAPGRLAVRGQLVERRLRRGRAVGPEVEVVVEHRPKEYGRKCSISPGLVSVAVEVDHLADRLAGGGAVAALRPAQGDDAARHHRHRQPEDAAG